MLKLIPFLLDHSLRRSAPICSLFKNVQKSQQYIKRWQLHLHTMDVSEIDSYRFFRYTSTSGDEVYWIICTFKNLTLKYQLLRKKLMTLIKYHWIYIQIILVSSRRLPYKHCSGQVQEEIYNLNHPWFLFRYFPFLTKKNTNTQYTLLYLKIKFRYLPTCFPETLDERDDCIFWYVNIMTLCLIKSQSLLIYFTPKFVLLLRKIYIYIQNTETYRNSRWFSYQDHHQLYFSILWIRFEKKILDKI